MGTNPSTNTFRGTLRGNAAGRGGSTHPAKGEVGKAPLGTSSTHPTAGVGKQKSAGAGDEKHHR